MVTNLYSVGTYCWKLESLKRLSNFKNYSVFEFELCYSKLQYFLKERFGFCSGTSVSVRKYCSCFCCFHSLKIYDGKSCWEGVRIWTAH